MHGAIRSNHYKVSLYGSISYFTASYMLLYNMVHNVSTLGESADFLG